MSTREREGKFAEGNSAVETAVAPKPAGNTVIGDTLVDAGPRGRAARLSLPGYQVGQVIGAGGMGEVLLAHDPDIGRDVAIKRMRADRPGPDEIARFLREARIQARLDHPAIVPVHELGTDAAGLPYFTMKRLAGATLTDVLAGNQRALPQLLRAFVDVCLAIDFAHARGIVHRDLKPSNVILGDYGEVYVLDWGIARVVATPEMPAGAASDIPTLDGKTEAGALLGTPGYMPPEQARGDADLGAPADVYALGAILFELLAGEALHPRGTAAIANTLATPTQSPATRAPQRAIAPELDAACIAALAAEPMARPTARGLADQVQRFLDGDRDVAHRRSLAADHLARAHTAARDPVRRAEAMRVAGRALALDPESADAAALVGQLMLEPPRELPAELVTRLTALDNDEALKAARTGSLALTAYLGAAPMALWMGVTDWSLFAAFYALVLVAIGVAYAQWVYRNNSDIIPLLLNGVLVGLLSRVMGPFVLLPVALCAVTISFAVQPQLVRRPWIVIAVAIGAIGVPVALEMLGLIASTWSVEDGRVVMSSSVLHLGGTPTIVFLIVSNVAVSVVVTLLGRSIIGGRRKAQHESEIQAWHLRQLLPEKAATG